MVHRVTLVPGDGIGPEVSRATQLVLEASGVQIDWTQAEAGAGALERLGATLPEQTLAAVKDSGIALKGPITTPVGTGFRSVNVALRQELDLFAAVRPCRSLPGVATRHRNVDLVVVRENTEDLYQGIEFEQGSEQAARLRERVAEISGFAIREDAGVTVKPISVVGTRRIVYFAFDFARWNQRGVVTVGHKANIMRFSDGLFLKTAREEAANHYDVEYREAQIDHLSMRLSREPQSFDVLLLPNLYGDILSDLCAGLVGGLGLVPGANLGWDYSVFEPVHGSAPDIAGKGLANPIAMILSGAMLLRQLGEMRAAAGVELAVDAVLGEGRVRTPDLGGDASTMQVAEAIAAAAAAGPS
jgi:isocitrate dehydrogenase (NAD+)